jgi:ribonuclease P protein component
MRFRPEQHLRRQSDIRAVREQGSRLDCRAFTVWWHRRSLPGEAVPAQTSQTASSAITPVIPVTARVCVIASTAAVGAAVQRNRAKRRLREVFRHHQHLVPADCDLLLVARSSAVRWPFVELAKRFSDACEEIARPATPKQP